ncbi:MAG: hypothetical protein COA79_11555 [Planctomycetota bacterium]|nr:MAG: hypothetical protein COA79_11555 [Planctomycetota bacterium]
MNINMIKSFVSELIYPEICVLCGEYNPVEMIDKEAFNKCATCCEKLINEFENYCIKCRLPVGKEHNAKNCTSCRNRSIYYDDLLFINEYKTYLGELILQFKYNKDRLLGLCLSELLSNRIINIKDTIDIIIPVPMFWVKKMMRGFNQSELIAYELSKYLKKPFVNNILQRKSLGKKQAGQSRTNRRANIKNIYSIKNHVEHKNILLVDDVVTTGSTLSECARVLKEGGAEKVFGAALAGVQRLR